MSVNLGKMGAVLVSLVALSLAASSTAPAAQFTAAKYPTTFSGTGSESNGAVKTKAGTAKCKKLSASATMSEASSTITVTGSASECTMFGFATAHVLMNGCYSLLHVTEGSGDKYKGTGDLVCPAGKEIIATPTSFGASVCSLRVFPQTGGVQIEFINDTVNGRVESKVLSLPGVYTSSGGPCGSAGEHSDGTLEQSVPATSGGKEKTLVIS